MRPVECAPNARSRERAGLEAAAVDHARVERGLPLLKRRLERRRTGLAELSEKRRKLLQLYYRDQISGELFAEEEGRIQAAIELLREQGARRENEEAERDGLLEQFEQVAALLAEMDIDELWAAATEQERRLLVDELVIDVTVGPEHLQVGISGAPRINVRYSEVGLKASQIVGVGGGT